MWWGPRPHWWPSCAGCVPWSRRVSKSAEFGSSHRGRGVQAEEGEEEGAEEGEAVTALMTTTMLTTMTMRTGTEMMMSSVHRLQSFPLLLPLPLPLLPLRLVHHQGDIRCRCNESVIGRAPVRRRRLVTNGSRNVGGCCNATPIWTMNIRQTLLRLLRMLAMVRRMTTWMWQRSWLGVTLLIMASYQQMMMMTTRMMLMRKCQEVMMTRASMSIWQQHQRQRQHHQHQPQRECRQQAEPNSLQLGAPSPPTAPAAALVVAAAAAAAAAVVVGAIAFSRA